MKTAKEKRADKNRVRKGVDNFKTWIKCVLVAAIFGVVQFVLSIAFCIWQYPAAFTMEGNYFSELGMADCQFAFLFNGSLIVLGLALLPAFATLVMINIKHSYSMRAAAAFGVISSCGLIILGLTPLDQFYLLHNAALALWLFPMIYMTMLFFFAAARSPYAGIGFIATSLVVVVGMIIVLLQFEVTSFQLLQKVIVVCSLIWLSFVIGFIWKAGQFIVQNWHDEIDNRAEKEAEYLSVLYGSESTRSGMLED